MKYLSTFSGIGGFEIGINKAYEDLQNRGNNTNSKQKEEQYTCGNKSISKETQEAKRILLRK